MKREIICMLAVWVLMGALFYFIAPLGFTEEEQPWIFVVWLLFLPFGAWSYHSMAKEMRGRYPKDSL